MGYNGLVDRITKNIETGFKQPDIKKGKQSDKVAAYKALDITVFFAKHGSFGGMMNSSTMFLNANLQGSMKFINAIDLLVNGRDSMNQENRRLQKEMWFKLALTVAMALGSAYRGKDDEDYKRAPKWERETYWIFPGGLRMAKDEIFGRSIGSAVETAYLKYLEEGKLDIGDVGEILKDIAVSFKPNSLIPAFIDTYGIGVGMNIDTFRGKDIVKDYLKKKPGPDQKDAYTHNLAVDISKVIKNTFNVDISAKMVDYVIQKQFTNAAKYINDLYDVFAGYKDKELPRGGKYGYIKDDVPRVLRNVTGTFVTSRTTLRQVDEFREEYSKLEKMTHDTAYNPMSDEDIIKWTRYKESKKEIDHLGKMLTELKEKDWSKEKKEQIKNQIQDAIVSVAYFAKTGKNLNKKQ